MIKKEAVGYDKQNYGKVFHGKSYLFAFVRVSVSILFIYLFSYMYVQVKL